MSGVTQISETASERVQPTGALRWNGATLEQEMMVNVCEVGNVPRVFKRWDPVPRVDAPAPETGDGR